MSKAKYIAFDTETGGTDPEKHPILTAFFLVLDEDFNEIASLDLAVRPEAPFDVIEAEALAVNNINMEEHLARKDLVSRKEAGTLLKAFVKKHKGTGVHGRPSPLGHNVQFDIDMLKNQILTKEEYNDIIHYRVVDTSPIANFYKAAGLLPKESGKLTSIAEFYGFEVSGAHDAKFDVYLCLNVYKKMISTLESLKNNSSNSSKSILELIEQ